jgi:hypothetical protein
MTYDDGKIACTDAALLVRWYYFPRGTKRLPYDRIREVRLRQLTDKRHWGSSDFVHWYNADFGRHHKHVELIIDTGRVVKPVITPDYPEQVADALTGHGVKISR